MTEKQRQNGPSSGGTQQDTAPDRGAASQAVPALESAVAQVWTEVLGRVAIGAADNFFDLGGDSLRAMEVISRLHGLLNVELPLIAFFEDPTISHLADVIRDLKKEPATAFATRTSATGALPLSFAQLTFWLLQQRDPLGYLYNQPRVLRIRGQLRPDILEQSLNEVCRRQEALRTRYVPGLDEPVQVIDLVGKAEFALQDLSSLASDHRLDAALALARNEWRKPLNLSSGPAVRARLMRLSEDDHVLAVVMHHLVSDGHTGSIFFDDLSAIYQALSSGHTHSLPDLTEQYSEYAVRERANMKGPELEHALAFWRSHLEDAPPMLNLPTDKARPEQPSYTGDLSGVFIAQATVDSLKELARTTGGTLFTVMLGALRILISRWTSQPDSVLGTVASNRSWPGSQRMAGCFLNFLPLRNRVAEHETVLDVLARERRLVMDAFAHQDCPFVKIAESLGPERAAGNNPLYNVAFLLQNFPELKFEGKSFIAEFLRLETETALLDLRFLATERADGLQLDCEFKTALFDRATIEHLLQGWVGILETIAANPGVRVSDVAIPRPLAEQAEAAKHREQEQTLAITATFTAEPVAESLNFWMDQLGVPSRIEFAPYNQVFQQLLDPSSLLLGNRDGVNIVLVRMEDWQRFQAGGSLDEAREIVQRNVQELADTIRNSAQRAPTPLLLCICPLSKRLLSDPVMAAFFARMEESLLAQLEDISGVHVVSSSELMELYPVEDYEDEYADKLGHIPYTPSMFTALGTMLARRISALRRPLHKVIVLDCDNTIWDGVCGEEGPLGVTVDEPRRALQEFMIAQQNSGMVLCLCSKNAEEDITAVFDENPGMVLRREHIVASRINWEPKSRNLRELAQELQLGLDSFIFLDDNPLECEEVKANCPEVLTIELPRDPKEIPQLLQHVWAFDRSTSTKEDKKRTAMYRDNVAREQLRKAASSLDDFLANLELEVDIRPVQPGDMARVAQLVERTNQFNFTTTRRTQAEIEQLCSSGYECLVVDLKDRFGDYGLVGVLIFYTQPESIQADSFLLSCRALGRKVEHRMLARLGDIAQSRGLPYARIDYLPTKKNRPAQDFIESIGSRFRIQGAGTSYHFPAEYAASVDQQPLTDNAIPLSSERLSSARPSPSPTQTAVLARIAAELRGVPAIAHEIESCKVLRSHDQHSFVAPRTPTEEIVAGIWARLLKVERLGIYDNFFALGGHSLVATQVVGRIRQSLGVELPLRAIFEAPTLAELTAHIEEVHQAGQQANLPPLVSISRDQPIPLSFAQQRLWFLDQLEPGNPLYNIPQMFRLRGTLNIDALRRSLREIVRRHETLRTTFATVHNEPVQVVSPALDPPLTIVELQAADNQREEEIQRLAEEEALRPFDLTQGPLIRARLLRITADDQALILVMHHIVSDRWSMGVLAEEMGKLYASFAQGRPTPLPELTTQHADFAAWQRSWLKGTPLEEHLTYWKKQLSGAPVLLEFPANRPRPAIQTFRGATVSRILPKELIKRLKILSQSEGVTLFMTLLAGFQVLVARYSGQEDIVVGSPIAGRNHADIEPLIGFFVNTLALRTDLSGDQSFRQLLARVKETALGAYAHQDIPFEKLVEELQPERSLSHNPIFQVMFALQNAPLQALELPGLKLERVNVYPRTSMFDMSWFAIEVPEGLLLRTEYNTDLFDESTITSALEHFENLLKGTVVDPDQEISCLPLIGEAERRRILFEFNDTAVDYPTDRCLHHFFEAQVERTPDAIALICEDQRLSYRELNVRANQLAHYLRKLGVQPDDLVGVCALRSVEMVVALYGIIKAGAAYVPLDPEYPQDRLAVMLDDARPKVLLTQEHLLPLLPKYPGNVLCLDRDWIEVSTEDGTNPTSVNNAKNLAYAIYTSGSTGKPKGVPNVHEGIVNRLLWMQDAYGLKADDRVLQKTPYSFDVSVWEFFWPLMTGASLVMARPEGHKDPSYLVEVIASQRITTLHFVPSMLQIFLQADGIHRCSSLRRVFSSGEALPYDVQQRFFEKSSAELHNLFGPTEAAVDVTYWACRRDYPRALVPIGHPIANTQIYLLDRHLQPVPIGVAGELHIGGIGLARGYLNRPDLTAEKFIPDQFSAKSGMRLYKTGDLARYLPDGTIEYLGRIDHQVKLRGFRIELGEIEAVLSQRAGVRQAIVMAREDRPGIKELVAYVEADLPGGVAEHELRNHLRQMLPEFMVPSAFVILESLPLSSNGKVDRKALPAPVHGRDDNEVCVVPRTVTETTVAEIWKELLHISQVGIHDNFFSLGGHSLLATQVISRLRSAFQVELPLRAIFESPTVAGIAERIEASTLRTGRTGIRQVSRQSPLPPSFAQQRLWFLDQLEPNTSTYNIPWALRMTGSLNTGVLEDCLNLLVQRHETLRTSFSGENGFPLQVIHPRLKLRIRSFDFTGMAEGEREREVRRQIAAEAGTPFRLNEAPLLRVTLMRTQPDQHILLANIHHIISDRWSMGVFARELTILYDALSRGKTSPLPELPVQYADFAVWQRERLQGEVLESQLKYWKEQLKDAPGFLELPTDRPRPPVESFAGDFAAIDFPHQLTRKLSHLGQAENATLFMVLLAGFQALLARYSGQDDIVLGAPIASRTDAEVEGLIGLFANTLPLRLHLADNPPFREMVQRAKEAALGAYAHQDMPFEKLVEELRPERSLSHNPLVQVFFILQNAPIEAQEVAGLQITPIESNTTTAKGDLFLSMVETVKGLRGKVEYNTDLFDASTIERMLAHYQVLLEAAVANPALKLSELPLLSASERQQVLVDWNATEAEYPEVCLHQLVSAQAQRTPDRVAVIFGQQQLSYRELEARSNQFAHYLRKTGVDQETLVGLCLERSLDMLVALLGILKAGGAYVPLDPSYPADRIRFILDDAQAPVLITQQSLLASLSQVNAHIVLIDTAWPEIARESSSPLEIDVQPESLAYVLYTSGSTGKPKGVQIEHRNVINFLASMQQQPGLTVGDTLLAVTTLSFDIAGLELYLPLITGAQLVLASREEAADGNKLLALLNQSHANVLQATPATWRMLIDSGWNGTSALKALCGGEALPADLAAQLVSRCSELWNMYGPTETTIWSSVFKVESRLDSTAPIGRPIANTTMYVLDSSFQPVPIGVAGELYIGGNGVARGYFKRPELTAEKFLADPFRPNERIYRTGDLAKFLPDSNIQFLGRADFQVKVRGFRIELGEIESVLAQHPALQQSVVIVREDQPGDTRLVAYLVFRPGQTVEANDLRMHLKQSLPDYMVPSAFVTLETLPLTPNGKIDRKALPKPDYARPALAGETPGAQTPVEEVMASIYAEVLKLDQVGTQDDFFELGGHSLLATQVVSRIRQAFQVELPLRALFEAPTVSGLAARVEILQRDEQGLQTPPLKPVPRNQPLPLSFAQQRLWFLDQLEPNNPLYNVPHIVRMQGELNVVAIEQALNEIVRRHESLRTTFETIDDQPVQVVAPSLHLPLAVSDLTSLPEAQREDEARRLAMAEVQRPFNLQTGPLLRALLFKLGDADHVLILNTHHIISDRWSLGVLSQELAALYEAYIAGHSSPLPELTIQYADYAVWQRNYLSGPTLDLQLHYWKQKLEGAPDVLKLPTDRPRQAVEDYWGGIHRQPLSPELVRDLRILGRRCSSTFFMTLIAAFQTLLSRQSGQEDIVVGTDLANRTQFDTEQLIGFFVNLLPIRTRIDANLSFQELLHEVRQTSLGAYAHQDIPFDKLVEELRPERKLTHNPLVQVLFVMQNTPQTVWEFAGLKLQRFGMSSTSRFDLVLFLNDPETNPVAAWVYNPNLFDASTIARMASLYETLLRAVASNPETRISALADHLSEAEKHFQASEQKKFQEASIQKLKRIKRKSVIQG